MTEQNHPLGVAQGAQEPVGYAPYHPKHGWRIDLSARTETLAECYAMRNIESAAQQGWTIQPLYAAQPPAAPVNPKDFDLELRAVQFSSQWGAGGRHAKMMAAFAAQEIASLPTAVEPRIYASGGDGTFDENDEPADQVETSDLVTRLDAHLKGDHQRGCDGRCYTCSCGFDAATEKLLEEALNTIGAQAMRLEACDAGIARLQAAPVETDVVADHMLSCLRGRGDKLCQDAADEIERLSRDLSESRSLCTKFEAAVGEDVATILELRSQLAARSSAETSGQEG